MGMPSLILGSTGGAVWPRRCRTTRWSVVLAAANAGDEQRDALAELYRSYWYPVFAVMAARRGREAAEELTQAFFVERILGARDLRRVDPRKCRRFRSWLFHAVESFLKNDWRHRRRKRRDTRLTVSFDGAEAELRCRREFSNDPERLFDRAWALCVLSSVIQQVGDSYTGSGPHRDREQATARFEKLKVFLPGPNTEPSCYAAVAQELQMTPDAVKQLVSRLRERFAELLRAEIGKFVDSESEVEDELRFLAHALAIPPSRYEPA